MRPSVELKELCTPWGCSSAGRAPALQAGGQEFDSPHLHHRAKEAKNLTTDVQSTRACSSGG